MDPCPEHFNRFGNSCFHVSTKQLNWKSASSTCRNLGSTLVEFETVQDENLVKASLQLDSNSRGKDYWTGGLNPGLLWIWSSSAKPVQNNTTTQSPGIKNIEGNGRCLLMSYQPTIKNYKLLLYDYFCPCVYVRVRSGARAWVRSGLRAWSWKPLNNFDFERYCNLFLFSFFKLNIICELIRESCQ